MSMKIRKALIVVLLLSFSSGDAFALEINKKCGIENCHGLDITCGPNVPEWCTEIYKLGDFCREYVQCGIVDNECVLIKDADFDGCKACVEGCLKEKDPADIFECEARCRNN